MWIPRRVNAKTRISGEGNLKTEILTAFVYCSNAQCRDRGKVGMRELCGGLE